MQPIHGLNEYQRMARETASYPNKGENGVYPAMGLAGEAGECCDKVKKLWRNTENMSVRELSPEKKLEIIKEMGDVLWYVANLAEELGVDLSHVAKTNIEKLRDRQERGTIKSEGDNR